MQFRWLLALLLFVTILSIASGESPSSGSKKRDGEGTASKPKAPKEDTPAESKPKAPKKKGQAKALTPEGVRTRTSNPLCPGVKEQGRRFTFATPLIAATVGAAVVAATGPSAVVAGLLVPVITASVSLLLIMIRPIWPGIQCTRGDLDVVTRSCLGLEPLWISRLHSTPSSQKVDAGPFCLQFAAVSRCGNMR